MRYEDQRLLLDFAKLMLRISIAKNPTAAMDMSEENVHRSEGYRKLRFFFMHLSPLKKPGMRRYLRNQVEGVRKLMAEAERTGEPFTLADIVIDLRDAASGEQFPEKPNVGLETADADEPSNDNQEEQPT